MSYYSGTANDMSALRQALIDACVLEGWSWNGTDEVLSKGALFLRLQITSGYLTLLGRTSATAGDAPSIVQIGVPIKEASVSYPVSYELFVFSAEVYLVINYSTDRYQWLCFGGSTVQSLAGSGMWFAASVGPTVPWYGVVMSPYDDISSNGSGGSVAACPGLFWRQVGVSGGANCWVHSDLDSQGWWLAQTVGGNQIGISASTLVAVLPNSWNSEAVLLPIRAYKIRAAGKVSLIADLEHARYTRVDNYTPGEIVIIGSERWKIYPWYRKNTAQRNGGMSVDHSGTMGWAIRYEGL